MQWKEDTRKHIPWKQNPRGKKIQSKEVQNNSDMHLAREVESQVRAFQLPQF